MTKVERLDAIDFFAGRIWDLLVSLCGAREAERYDFIASIRYHGLTEYRFQGTLGFGGKVYRKPLRVSCYPEDENPVRREAIKLANESLVILDGSALRAQFDQAMESTQ